MSYRFTMWVAAQLFIGACCAVYLLGHSALFGHGRAYDIVTTAGFGIVAGTFLFSAVMLLLRGTAPPKIR